MRNTSALWGCIGEERYWHAISGFPRNINLLPYGNGEYMDPEYDSGIPEYVFEELQIPEPQDRKHVCLASWTGALMLGG